MKGKYLRMTREAELDPCPHIDFLIAHAREVARKYTLLIPDRRLGARRSRCVNGGRRPQRYRICQQRRVRRGWNLSNLLSYDRPRPTSLVSPARALIVTRHPSTLQCYSTHM